jgi:hypothetical protein
MKSRKVILFIVTLIAVIVLAILSKDTAAIVALYGTYCAGNVGAKFSGQVHRYEIEDK